MRRRKNLLLKVALKKPVNFQSQNLYYNIIVFEIAFKPKILLVHALFIGNFAPTKFLLNELRMDQRL
jgi:hypothetical protein